MDAVRQAAVRLRNVRTSWKLMPWYDRFEQIVVFSLGALIAIVIVAALLQLFMQVIPLLLGGALNPLDHEVFQGLFGTIMTLLIAMEFKHSIVRVSFRRNSIVQVRTVILIALLALSRKFILLDTRTTSAAVIAAVAIASFALGAVYWVLKDRERHRDHGETEDLQ
jgi:uncharacterized membrane protein (DUF373 family)